jgi:3-oxoacyl-(acyl-carrier-protein) synthase
MFIRDLNCISPQPTFENDFFAGDVTRHIGGKFIATEPSYAGLIPNGILRRMGKSNRMATGSAMPLLSKYSTDGIIIGTTDGGMNDCHRFLDQIINYEEGILTPTAFVQGSPNSVAGGLALMSANDGYNITHSNKGLSFENSILDAMMLFKEGEAKQLLIGAVEEISNAQFRIETLAGHINGDVSEASDKSNMIASSAGEGAAMFVVDQKQEGAIAEIIDVGMISVSADGDVFQVLRALLRNNNLRKEDIDTAIIGLNGDLISDHLYRGFKDEMHDGMGLYSFKNLFGESPSASAFATWFGAHILTGKTAPEIAQIRPANGLVKTLLIYNCFQGTQHGFILLRAV